MIGVFAELDKGVIRHLISTTTIRAEMEDHIKREGGTLQQFAELAGVNVGTLSGILNGNRPIALGQLDRITMAMGLSEGYFYDLYVDECFIPTAPHWRRLRPFLLRCAEIDRLDCIEQVLGRLLEDLKQVGGIFETAELMLEQGWKEAAAVLYEVVIESERSNHSERLSMSYFRLFQIYQSDPRKGFKAALQFLPYCYRLPEALTLDGLLMLTEVYAVRFNLSEVENYADELSQFAWKLYERKIWQDPDFKPARPLVFYYGKAYLYKSGACDLRGMFEESRRWIAEYADLSWFEGMDEAGIEEVRQLQMFAEANYLIVDIKCGNRSNIPEYVAFLEAHPDEVVEGLITLIESANRHLFYIDDVLDKFSNEIEQYMIVGKEDWFTESAEDGDDTKAPPYFFRYSVFFQDFALYNFRKGSYEEGLKHILYSMNVSIRLGIKDVLVNSMAIFEMYRPYASETQCSEYYELCRRVWENEKENVLGGFGYAYA